MNKRVEMFSGAIAPLSFFKDAESMGMFTNWLGGMKTEHLLEMIDAVRQLASVKEEVSTSRGLALRVEAGLRVMRAFSKMTATTADDQVLDTLDLLLNAGLLPVVCDLVEKLLAHIGDDDPDEVAVSSVLTGEHCKVLFPTEWEAEPLYELSWEQILPLLISVVNLIRQTIK